MSPRAASGWATQPILHTERLLLRPFAPADAPRVQQLAGDRRIADTTASIPHPYPDGLAEAWIATHARDYEQRSAIVFAVTLRAGGELLGAVSLLDISMSDARAELGYWIAVGHWSKGYCTEAVRRVIAFGREQFGFTRILSCSLARNPASVRVMEKCGLQFEGRLAQHTRKNGRFEDLLLYATVLPGRGD